MRSITKYILAIAVLAYSSTGLAKPLQADVDQFIASKGLEPAAVGIYVEDMQGRALVKYNENMAIGTASTIKTLTSASALALLGKDYRFKTKVYLEGKAVGSRLVGNIVVVGDGDPTLGSRYLQNESFPLAITKALQKRGIQSISGKLITSQGVYFDYRTNNHVELGDESEPYGAGTYGLNYKDNITSFTITNTKTQGIKCSLPSGTGMKVVNKLKTGPQHVNYRLTYDDPQALILLGSLPVSPKAQTYIIANNQPQQLLSYDIEQKLKASGIKLEKASGQAVGGNKELLLEYKSLPLAHIIRSLLVRSDNQYSEALLLAIAKKQGKQPTTANGIACVKGHLNKQGLATDALFLYDGSGLSRRTKASPHFLADMLRVSLQEKTKQDLAINQLMAKIGVDYNLGKTIANSKLKGQIAAKSGSMRDVNCYVGYYPADKPEYSWSILVNNYNCSRKELNNNIDTLLYKLFSRE